MRIHKEGYRTIFWSLAISIVLQCYIINNLHLGKIIFFLETVIIFGFFGWIVYFFRNPIITPTIYSKGVVSPATGTVISIQEIDEPEYFKDKRLQICVFMSPIDLHINRNPVSGIVKFFKHHKGKYLVAWHPKSSTKNERTTVVIQNEQGIEILFRQIAGFVARRICYYDTKDKIVKQGNECGFIKFGSRADVFLPLNSNVKVKIDDKMKAGISIIAELNL